ncbi:MAG: 16S rRNA (guanine(527)-N(7))-methyltransferase RsmG, partial [Rhodoferax sp.]|nr:16S rRNA (guanine(527)-N(7))-methyltransferase RsmG [Rhodoferax sp.]
MVAALQPALRQGLQALGLSLEDRQVGQLLDYLALLDKWGRVYNLTAVRDPAAMLTHHLLDSLSVVQPLLRVHPAPGRLLDVGSGAGLPGVVVAICCPDWAVDCVDAVAKKAAFVQQVALTLGLPRLRGLHARVESLPGQYPVVSARAFASLADLVRVSASVLAPDGVWMAMKGQHPQVELDELAELSARADLAGPAQSAQSVRGAVSTHALPCHPEVFHVEPLWVPGLDAERCLVWMRRAGGAK